MITRRRVLLAVLALFLVGVGTVAWTLAGLPPVKYYFRYGLDPYCEPTGAKETHEGVEFVEIGPGIFRMGSTFKAEGGDWLGKLCAPLGLPWGKKPKPSNEMPVHWVEFRRGYWIATTEITKGQYKQFRSNWVARMEFRVILEPPRDRRWVFRPEALKTPVVRLSWDDAKAYCDWLSKKTGRQIRLPSEAEWECACRAGQRTEYSFGDEETRLGEFAWFRGNSDWRERAVGTKRRNQWGLYDLHGNASEWCEEAFHDDYDDAPTRGEPWTHGGKEWEPGSQVGVVRGGDYGGGASSCRSAARSGHPQAMMGLNIGFRPAFSNPGD